jgi:3-phenylpropionate/cinnamic acid dioxygenase small subunit
MSKYPTVSVNQYLECDSFLNYEAELLDQHELSEWLELLSEDITYQIPVRTTRGREADSDFSSTSYHMKDDFSSLQSRVNRLETEYDWSENPPSRTKRFVTNLRISTSDDTETIECKSNLLVYRGKGDNPSSDIIPCERHDTLVRKNGELKLERREVQLAQTVLDLESGHSLSIFL